MIYLGRQHKRNKYFSCYGEPILGNKNKYVNYLIGQFMGFIQRKCRKVFQFKLLYFPIIFHNLSWYDANLFIMLLGPNLSVTQCNMEFNLSITERVMEGNGVILNKFCGFKSI